MLGRTRYRGFATVIFDSVLGSLELVNPRSLKHLVQPLQRLVGYCFGGAAVLELARSGEADNVADYATFHGGLSTPEGHSYPSDTPPILVAHDGADTSITMEDVAALSRELEAASVPYEVQVYSGAPHSLTHFGSDQYQKWADQQSWNAFQEFLATNLSE